MTRHQTAFLRQVLLATDVLVSALAFVAALAIRERAAGLALPEWTGRATLGPVVGVAEYGTLLLGLVPVWLAVFGGLNTGEFRDGLTRCIGRYARAVAVALVLLVIVQFMLKFAFLSRAFVASFAVLQLVGLAFVRALIRAAVKATSSLHDHRVLIVGRGEAAAAFARALRDRSAWNNRLLGHVSVPGDVPVTDVGSSIGRVEDLAEILDAQPVDEVVFAVNDREHPAVQAALEACDVRGVEVLLTMQGMPSGGRIDIASVTGFDLPMIGLSRGRRFLNIRSPRRRRRPRGAQEVMTRS